MIVQAGGGRTTKFLSWSVVMIAQTRRGASSRAESSSCQGGAAAIHKGKESAPDQDLIRLDCDVGLLFKRTR